MSYEFAKKEIGDYRITIYQDEDASISFDLSVPGFTRCILRTLLSMVFGLTPIIILWLVRNPWRVSGS